MRYFIVFLLMLTCGGVVAQTKTVTPATGNPNTIQHARDGYFVDSVFMFRPSSGMPTYEVANYIVAKRWPILAADTTNSVLYWYNPATSSWISGGSGGQTGDTAYLNQGFGVMMINVFNPDDSLYKPNGPDIVIMVDTAALVSYLNNFYTNIVNYPDSAQFNFIVFAIDATPDFSYADGTEVLVAASGTTGVFVGKENWVAKLVGGVYTFPYGPPQSGQQLIVSNDEDPDNTIFQSYRFDGTNWIRQAIPELVGGMALGVINTFGTTDSRALIMKTNDINRVRINPNGDLLLLKLRGPTIKRHNFLKIVDTVTGRVGVDTFLIPIYSTPALQDSILYMDNGVMKYGTISGGGGSQTWDETLINQGAIPMADSRTVDWGQKYFTMEDLQFLQFQSVDPSTPSWSGLLSVNPNGVSIAGGKSDFSTQFSASNDSAVAEANNIDGSDIYQSYISTLPDYFRFGKKTIIGEPAYHPNPHIIYAPDTLLTEPEYIYVSDNDTIKKYPFSGGGGGSAAGNYGNVQLNRNSVFATPASDSLSFNTANLNIKGGLSTTANVAFGVGVQSERLYVQGDSRLNGTVYIDGNTTFAANGTPGTGKVPTGTDAGGNWTWEDVSGGSSVVFDSLTWISAKNWGILPTNSEATNTTNATAALNYLIDRGGGTLYLPYADSAYKVRIEVPYIPISSTWTPIQLLGATPPYMYGGTIGNYTLPTKGIILKSGDTTTGRSVIRALTSGSAFSGVALHLNNIDVRTYNKPKIGGIDAQYAAIAEMENVIVSTDTYSPNAGDPSTVRQTSGIILPMINNSAESNLNNVWVSGYFNGIVANELTSGHNVNVFACWNGVVVPANYHAAHFDKLGIYRCRYGIKGTGGDSWIYIDNIDTEHPGVGQTVDSTAWQQAVYDINDSLNLIHGFATYNNVIGLAGVVQSSFIKNGGTNLFTYSVDSTDFFGRRRNNVLTGANYFTGNNTYAGTNQHNGYEKFYANLLANKIGIGDSSFTHLLGIKGTTTSVGQAIESTNSAAEVYSLYYAGGSLIGGVEGFGPTFTTAAVQNSLGLISTVNNSGAINFLTTTGGSSSVKLKVNNSGTLTVNGAYTLPNADGSANYYLQTDGSGTVSWQPAGSGWTTSGSTIYPTSASSIIANGATVPSFGGTGSIVAYDPTAGATHGTLVHAQIGNNANAFGGFSVGYGTGVKWLMGISKGASDADAFTWYEDASASNPRFAVFTGGNVAIGTGTNSGFKLDVQGTGRFTGAVTTTQVNVGGSVKWLSGSGSPEGVVTAVVGSLYSRTDGGAGTTLYVKESGSGNTGWVAK